MGNTPSESFHQKYDREFNKEQLNDKTQFDYREVRGEFGGFKQGSDQFDLIDKGIEVVNTTNNSSLKIHDPHHITVTRDGTKFDLVTRYENPKTKYCVKTNGEREYCSCDLSILDLSMDIFELKSKL
jgi:hypothetical protein